jgi:hypothetical protein
MKEGLEPKKTTARNVGKLSKTSGCLLRWRPLGNCSLQIQLRVQMPRQNNTCANKLLFWFMLCVAWDRTLKTKMVYCRIESYFPFKCPGKLMRVLKCWLIHTPRYYTNSTIITKSRYLPNRLHIVFIPHHKKKSIKNMFYLKYFDCEMNRYKLPLSLNIVFFTKLRSLSLWRQGWAWLAARGVYTKSGRRTL